MVKNKFCRIGRYCSVSIVFLLTLVSMVIPAFSYTYSDNYPDSLPMNGCVYIEVNSSNLGRGTIVLPYSAKKHCLSLGSGTYNIFNISGSQITGIFRSSSGQDYNIRIASFDQIEYRTEGQGSFNYTYYDLIIREIYNTNVEFVDFSGSDTQNDKYFFDDNFDKAIFTLIIIISIVEIINLFLTIFKKES